MTRRPTRRPLTRRATRCPAVAALAAAMLVGLAGALPAAEPPRNVVLLIGDGMGFEQVKAASLYAAGQPGKLAFEPYYRAEMTTASLDSHRTKSKATDSAAAGTALATGSKTKNGALASAPDGADLKTVLEVFAERAAWTGLVTTVPMTHATPAAFASHSGKRSDFKGVAEDYFARGRPNVLFGAYYKTGSGVTEKKARDAGYAVVRTRDELEAFVAGFARAAAAAPHLCGPFATDLVPWEYDGPVTVTHALKYKAVPNVDYTSAPHLREMTEAAVKILARSPKGFFLMVEGGMIDWACHDNFLERSVHETVEFAKAFEAVMAWARPRTDTLVLVTADHETGGLKVLEGRGQGQMPEVSWKSRDHTPANVPVYAWGPGADRLAGVIDNTDLFPLMTGLEKPPQPVLAGTAVPAGAAAEPADN